MAIGENTTILVNTGNINAKDLALDYINHQIVSYNVNTSELIFDNIKSANTIQVQQYYQINFVTGKFIICDADQQFLLVGNGYVKASELDPLESLAGILRNEVIVSINVINEPIILYKFEVYNIPNFFGNGVLMGDNA